jgi:hypothetical protein
MELAGGITGYMLKDDVRDMLQNTVNKSMSRYPYDKEITKSWDIMQHDVSTLWHSSWLSGLLLHVALCCFRFL